MTTPALPGYCHNDGSLFSLPSLHLGSFHLMLVFITLPPPSSRLELWILTLVGLLGLITSYLTQPSTLMQQKWYILNYIFLRNCQPQSFSLLLKHIISRHTPILAAGGFLPLKKHQSDPVGHLHDRY